MPKMIQQKLEMIIRATLAGEDFAASGLVLAGVDLGCSHTDTNCICSESVMEEIAIDKSLYSLTSFYTNYARHTQSLFIIWCMHISIFSCMLTMWMCWAALQLLSWICRQTASVTVWWRQHRCLSGSRTHFKIFLTHVCKQSGSKLAARILQVFLAVSKLLPTSDLRNWCTLELFLYKSAVSMASLTCILKHYRAAVINIHRYKIIFIALWHYAS